MTERVRLLSLIKGLGPGGAEQLLVSAARVRNHDRIDEEIAYLLPGEPSVAPALERLQVRLHYLRGLHVRDVGWMARLRRLLVEGRYDVVHVHSPYVAGMARIALRSIPASRRPRLVSTEHNVWSSHAQLSRALNEVTFPMGDAWFAVSDEVRESTPRLLRSRIEVLVHGIVLSDVEHLVAGRAAVRAELGLRPDEIAIVTIANYRKQKGYPDLLEAARILKEGGVPARLFVIGQGPLEAEVHALHRELRLDGYVEILGYRADAMRIAAGCDIFALASHYEGLPVAIMEALAVGLPIVATRVGGVGEAVQDGVEGLIVPPHRPDRFAHALETLARDEGLRTKMSVAAAKRSQDYDISVAVARLEDVYAQLQARPRR